MVLAYLVPGSFVNNNNNMQETLQPEYDWQNDKLKYREHQIGEMPSWIKTKKDALGPAVMLRLHTYKLMLILLVICRDMPTIL